MRLFQWLGNLLNPLTSQSPHSMVYVVHKLPAGTPLTREEVDHFRGKNLRGSGDGMIALYHNPGAAILSDLLGHSHFAIRETPMHGWHRIALKA